ncbi:LLM class F420-dependent oxidoreductase [Streptomyces europaeiscabiei]|uniref:LLM class F420-dependent oxidoreductase n=1 Tax=Streptomyces europaeiscabiei TaxID=146819 RepID=A0ABU4NBF0_9ACTN|nr:LLM class F420-dependent oxidoreductase [Streptomyces europaeiscabiei]MDX2524062.1 LLM class F420-dependent oxidoreductase [Streptomyces europaeiscabiei]MDX2762471.1 LLM class F420-dependent oxidoreductase [Streptomyces europaeiscabiei]MDX2771748.1 LLM class F420-dependent oxidoreductase [Streptomyces europaeiscabiei]MDX3545341.1 LLM class F420-dependent oxidoreductase [Streptomyces europaeiscabiei]MDX3554332.1 LLM class F420-dependent oxidoreductase [Streptomyces europaeiscabiei]
MRLGLALGYWGRGPSADHVPLAQEAERLGYDSVWTAESWGSDAFTPLTWIAAHTSRIKLGTAVAQMAARSPTTTAMHALTLDHLSGGRALLGLGLSGPQVVEGWYGRPFPRSPLTATREYVDVVRQVLRRAAPVELPGRFHPLPYDGPDGTGIGKALKSITHPLRADLPVLLGAEGPKNIAQTARIADGWLPLYWSPTRTDVYEASLTEMPDDFLIAPMARAKVCDDVAEGLLPVKAMLGFYIGGMGHARRNFHADLMARMGYAEEARHIQRLFLDGRREEAVLAVPDAFADEISLVGPRERIAERLELWRKGPVTDLLVLAPDPHTLRVLAELNS